MERRGKKYKNSDSFAEVYITYSKNKKAEQKIDKSVKCKFKGSEDKCDGLMIKGNRTIMKNDQPIE